jgi:hypothetical protein
VQKDSVATAIIRIQLLLRAQAQVHFGHELKLGHDHATGSGRCSVTAVIVLRGRESITGRWAITHLRDTVHPARLQFRKSNDKGDADKTGFPMR